MATSAENELYLACRNGNIATVERLLPQIPLRTLNSLQPNGSTCLHTACENNQSEIVRLLLARGASRRVIDRNGRTPLDKVQTQEIADLFPRSTEESKQRFADNPVEQPEWQFDDANAEDYARATHWNCIKDRGIKKTVKKVQKSYVLEDDQDEAMKVVQSYFKDALETKDPICLLKAYTLESQFYKRLNHEMATGTPRKVYKKLRKGWTGYYTGVIVKNPVFDRFRFAGQTYRGMQITETDFSQYRPMVALTNKSFQSTSKSWKIARGFACPSRPIPERLPVVIIFTILDRRSALYIEEISEFQNEEEVLIVPGTLFIVAEINTDEIPYEVQLRQIPWEDEF